MDPARDASAPPQRMGRYEVLFRIAAGGMAEVFAARVHGEAGFEKLVAVKRMLPTLADDEEFVTMFLDEARVAANISSPHVVQTLDLGRDDHGALYIAMELVVGVTLSRIVKEAAKQRRAVPVPMAVELLAQAALGLHAAHVATTPIGQPLDIIHRDVSPQNILVGIDGRARLTDFGVARAVLRSTKTDAGRIKGKFAYCSPEQLRSDNIDQRSDIFALGVVAWEALAGQRLFVADHPLATMERVTNMPILPLHQVRSDVPPEVSAVVEQALARDRESRFRTAQEFATALRSAAQGVGLKLPVQSEVSQFIRAAGGEPLRRMRDNIQKALAQGSGPVPTEVFDDAPTIVSSTGTADTDAIANQQDVSRPEPDASGVARIPGSLFPGAIPEETPAPSNKSTPIKVAVALAALLAIVGGVWWAQPGPATDEMGVPLVETQNDGRDVPPQAEEPTPTPVAAPEPVAVPEPVAMPDPAGAVDENSEAVPDEGAIAAPVVRTRRRRPRRPASMASMVTPMAVAERPAAMTTRPAATSRPSMQLATPMATSPAPSPMESTMSSSMRGPLVGVDAFDRELGR